MNDQQPSKLFDITIWSLQAIIALFFLLSGLYNLLLPVKTLAAQMSYVRHFPVWGVRMIAISEILGAAGLALPTMLKREPILVSFSASGLVILMILATIYHFSHNEASHTPMTIMLAVITGFIAWARYKKSS